MPWESARSRTWRGSLVFKQPDQSAHKSSIRCTEWDFRDCHGGPSVMNSHNQVYGDMTGEEPGVVGRGPIVQHLVRILVLLLTGQKSH